MENKSSDVEIPEGRVSFFLTETNINMIRIARISKTQAINLALDNYFTFNLSVYIIVHRLSNRFHIGFFEDHEPHDLHWHHIYNTGSGTVGDEIRREGMGRFKFEIIGKFSSIEHLARISKFYQRRMSKKARPYKSFKDDDSIEILLRTYSKSIGKYHAKKENKNL